MALILTHRDNRDHNPIGLTCAYLWWSFVKGCEQKWATQSCCCCFFLFFLTDWWAMPNDWCSTPIRPSCGRAPSGCTSLRWRYGFIGAESGERGHRSQRWQANIMSASADNDVIDMGVRGWRGINICKVPWKLMEESSQSTLWGSWFIQTNHSSLSLVFINDSRFNVA